MFEFFIDNQSVSSDQSCFKPRDSCINQLLCITHDIYQSVDDGLKTRADFLDISNVFDKVWQEGLLYINWVFNSKPNKTKRCFERAVFNMG